MLKAQTSNRKWKDCFGRELKAGEDVVYAKIVNDEVQMHSGVIFEVNADSLIFSYNEWIGEEEYVYSEMVCDGKYPDNTVPYICKIFL